MPDEVPTVLISNLKIGGRGPFWLNVPFFPKPSYGGYYLQINAIIPVITVQEDEQERPTIIKGTQIGLCLPVDLAGHLELKVKQDDTIVTAPIKLVNTAVAGYKEGNLLYLLYDGQSWITLN